MAQLFRAFRGSISVWIDNKRGDRILIYNNTIKLTDSSEL
jgi:hypothetical protein